MNMRKENKAILCEYKTASYLIEQISVVEAFLDDLSFLVVGRDNIVCKNYIFSLQRILNSSQATLGNVVECCKCFCLADAYTLLRKYRDDLFFCLYLVTYDVNIKGGITKSTSKMETNIEQWCENNLSNLNISEVLSTIGSSDSLKDAVRKYGFQKNFERIGKLLNNYTHGNGYSFYNCRAGSLDEKNIEKQLTDIVSTAQYITTTFLFLLVLCSPQYIMSTDYIDHLEFGQTPPEGSQYWVAPFVVKFFKNNVNMIDESCYEYLRETTYMEL
jgi:CRISPR/Cas system-associated endoribonuclease Cas2